ncbi:hypothetical protein LTR36_000641 [Oleoguttula mirabilis]|uniref:Uncharacterized protein n=1 Tax=Oleoguttula mirabilis TaxID=1507867 RepID=A0AAV9JRS3_9PEZI|nr:hypothetical protein LTR36_000641 [Oleoguttula mirabilis]
MVEGRWREVLWLVKHLVENFASGRPKAAKLSQTIWPWSNEGSLDAMTLGPIDLDGPKNSSEALSLGPTLTRTLHELTDDLKPENMSRTELLQRGVLGQIWRSLGAMILACPEGVVKPEILEIIAYLHHQEIMPTSIYSQKPGIDESAIQQPPTLHLLSSRILTSLSDAAWRAHERVVVEEARSKGGEYVALRPEIPGMAYKVHVAGLRTEIWLELVLWACLHGGWIMEGAAVLRSVYRQNPAWKPLSWRSILPSEKTGPPDWDKLDYLFNTKSSATMDPPANPTLDVSRTVSSEVVNAYVDALLSVVDVGVGERGAPPGFILSQLKLAKKFLGRADLKLGGGSWDAVILRFVDSQAGNPMHLFYLSQLGSLTPSFGHEVESSNASSLPEYVSDGSASFVGLCHRALHMEVKAGNTQGALRVFKLLQDITDSNKRKSLEDFFNTIQHAQDNDLATSEAAVFTSNYSQINYPVFDLQIPTTTLGPFLELVTDAQAYEVGKWLLYSKEVDGPLIPDRLYNDPAIAPALIKFATKADDRALLSKLIDLRAQQNTVTGEGPTLPSNVLMSFLETQFGLCSWDAAIRILDLMNDSPTLGWNLINLATLARTMLILRHAAMSGDLKGEQDLARAQEIFSQMVQGVYSRSLFKAHFNAEQVSVLLTVLSAVDAYWASFCCGLRQLEGHYNFNLSATSFDRVLEGVLEAYGSATARRLLGMFWSHALRTAQGSDRRMSEGRQDAAKVARFRQSPLDSTERQRTLVHLPGQQGTHVVVYGGLRPRLTTVRVIFRKALDEMKQQRALHDGDIEDLPLENGEPLPTAATPDSTTEPVEKAIDHTPFGMVVWAVRRLRALGMADEDVRTELREALEERELRRLQVQLPRLFGQTDGDEEADD